MISTATVEATGRFLPLKMDWERRTVQNVKNGPLHVSIAVAMLWAAVFNVIPIKTSILIWSQYVISEV